MEIFFNPNVPLIISVASLILAIAAIYMGYKNSEKKSVLFMHFENTQILNRDIFKETALISTSDIRMKEKDLFKLTLYLSNDGNRVIELSDWSEGFNVEFEDNETETLAMKFFSTNKNVRTDNVKVGSFELSFRFGEFEPEDVFKVEIKYFSKTAQKGKFEYKLKGRKKEVGEIFSDHHMLESYAEGKYFNRVLFGAFPITIGLFYFIIYHLLLMSFNLTTKDLVTFYKSNDIGKIIFPSLIFLFLIMFTVPIIIRIHSLFVPFYRKLRKIKDYFELETKTPAPNK